jgi:hypothetical protein
MTLQVDQQHLQPILKPLVTLDACAEFWHIVIPLMGFGSSFPRRLANRDHRLDPSTR